MFFEKIVLLWQQSWLALMRTPLTTWAGLLFLHLTRFYYVLCVSHGWLLLSVCLGALIFVNSLLLNVILKLFVLSLIAYLMRPTVGLKNVSYLTDFFSLESLTCVFFLIIFFLVIALCAPPLLAGVIYLTSLCSFSFLFDARGSIPDKVGYALIRTAYFIVYKAPIFLSITLVTVSLEYYSFGIIGTLFKVIVFYPFLAALCTIAYVSAIHDNYELYYAE